MPSSRGSGTLTALNVGEEVGELERLVTFRLVEGLVTCCLFKGSEPVVSRRARNMLSFASEVDELVEVIPRQEFMINFYHKLTFVGVPDADSQGRIFSGRVFGMNIRAQRKLPHAWIILDIVKQNLAHIHQIDGPIKYLS